MTTTYNDYRRALSELKALPDKTAADLDDARQTHARAEALADTAVTAAESAADGTTKAIEAQLAAARAALKPLGKANLVPPRIRPSAVTATATREDVAQAQQVLAIAVNRLRQVVQSEIQRVESERERLARAAVERQRLAWEPAERVTVATARHKKAIRFGLAGALLVIVLVVISIVVT